ncbi:MAG: L-aspartate oxidase [Gammaproteobacteria bacterium]
MTNQVISQRGDRYEFDVLVFGGGLAGLSYILELLKIHPTLRVALLTKTELSESNSAYAQGGIAAAIQPPDSIPQHLQDTLVAGDGLCDHDVVESITLHASESIDYLVKLGVQFTRNTEGELECGHEAGHSQRRIYHCGDATGAEIIKALLRHLQTQSSLTIFEEHMAVRLIKRTRFYIPGEFPEIIGAYVLDEKTSKIHTFLAKVVVLATGGAGKVYRYTSNPDIATGDGIAMAYRAGARVRNMEFYQFHPTLLYHPKKHNFLISEALRGEGAYLRRVEDETRFMKDYAPEMMELATRDVVSRAIFTEIERSHDDYVYLDIRHKNKAFLQKRFPVIYQTLQSLGLDLAKDLIPVVPAAHYLCGGVLADVHGQTDLQRLFVIGETAATGLHGANRLASNSLLECIIMGRNAAHACSPWLSTPTIDSVNDWDSTSVVDLRRATQISANWRGLRGEMSSYAGIIRTEKGLSDLLKLIIERQKMVEEYYWNYVITRDVVELRNIITVAELIVRSALRRRESRGGHFREDFPNKYDQASPYAIFSKDTRY